MNFQRGLLAIVFAVAFTPPAFTQDFGGAFKGMSNTNEPVQIEADKLEVLDAQNKAILTGNVNVVQGSTILKAGQITVFYLSSNSSGSNSGIREIIASGGRVAVRSGDNLATADRAVVNMQTEIVTMTGDVVISQGENVVNGCSLRVNLKTSVSEFKACGSGSNQGGGRIKLLLKPKSGG